MSGEEAFVVHRATERGPALRRLVSGGGCRWLVGALLLAPLLVTGCAGTGVDCSTTLPATTIIGRLISRHGSIATFTIEAVTQPSTPVDSEVTPPKLTPGQSIDVAYDGDHAVLALGILTTAVRLRRRARPTQSV